LPVYGLHRDEYQQMGDRQQKQPPVHELYAKPLEGLGRRVVEESNDDAADTDKGW
jgi:hypothetical protein